MRGGLFRLFPSPTSSGKSYNGATTEWKDSDAAGGKPVIHLHGTTNAREEGVDKSEDADVEYRELLGGEEACKTRAGEYDDEVATPSGIPASEWFHTQVTHRENTMSQAHSYLAEYNNGDLPCSPCPSIEQWDDIPYDEDGEVTADVIHATHNFAYVPSLVHNANIFFDEQPDFKCTIGDTDNDGMSRSRFQDIITAWLKEIQAFVTSWEHFVTMAKDGGLKSLQERLNDPPDVDTDWFIEEEDAHALAPALTEAAYDALTSEPDQNGRRVGRTTSDITRFDRGGKDDFRYSRTRITLIIGEDNTPTVFWNVPELGNARSIICLDAWPSLHEWKQNIGDNLDIERIVTDEEFVKWRKFERGLEVVQIGNGAKPASTEFAVEHYTNPCKQKIVIKSLRNEYGEDFRSAIYPDAMEDQIQSFLTDDFIIMTHGNVKSNNKFANEKVGLVTNSIDPGDDYVLDLLAARGLNAEPERVDCAVCDNDDPDCPICEGEPERKPGREFVGVNADTANEMLAGIRENSVAQAIGRWARKDESPRALVFVRTDTGPNNMVDTKIDGAWKFTQKQKAVIDYLGNNHASSVSEIVESTDVSKSSVHRTTNRLIEYEVAKRREISGTNRYMLTGWIADEGVLNLSHI